MWHALVNLANTTLFEKYVDPLFKSEHLWVCTFMHLHIPILFRLLLLSGHEAKVDGLLLQMIWTVQLIYCMESMYKILKRK